ncbi:telomere length regulator protein [Sporothrix brasiliensis 5110]|uniref:Telomere length regulator protein n=1 Tax=Sporothrix brasiliensis 5110 TaxID=1398154 RepID=A0A0C2IJX7_9PEZI|nr:telomere length regulator protein [Sporothrix brasiliensis 5110]KIH89461.1 telomere length regulator protein [Sporothrix brasiliensis 5110]
MAEVAPARLLESLPARPPTPPRETQVVEVARKQPLLAASRCNPLDPRSSLHTPPSAQSLVSSATKTGSTGSRQKKVEFSAKAEYKEPPVYTETADRSQTNTTPPIVVLPPSSSASRPTKSILKATAYEAVIPSSPTNISDMLASTVQQLVGADRDSKLDAYMMLARALKTSDNLPDRIALQSKMPLFTQFIQRDITSPKTLEGALDSTLVIAALDLLNTFLRFSAIASTLSNDFGVFIIDHCIRSFEVSSVPRDVLRTLMRVVALQSFPAKVMTSDRVGRLVAALHNMDEQYESKNTIVMRSIIYRTLVKNNKMLMTVHLEWMPDLLADMVSTVPHIREAAISLGLEAAFALGRERPTSQRLGELLQATVEDERYLDYYANRLQTMTKNKAEASSVPQIWSVVTLFLRTLEKWDFLMKWLHILQACFNSSDYRTKEEANYAWSRFTYALLRNNRTLSKKMTVVLNQALVSQLRRRGSGKQADDFRKVVLGCVCNLFYYAMHDASQLDNTWDNVVRPVVLQLLELSTAEESTREKRKVNLTSACTILTGLIDCSAPRPWKEDHIAKSPIVSPEDLPAVDAKWIRRNADRVFALVGPILEQNFLELATPRSATQILWQAVVGAVSAAAAKEIKVSPETAAFVGHVLSLLLKVWTNGVPSTSHTSNLSGSVTSTSQTNDSDITFATTRYLAAAREFLLTTVDSLGCLPFTEKQLSRDERNAFVPVATPSQRAGKGHSVSRTPLRHLFSILSSLPPGVQDDEDFSDFVESIFAPFFSAKSAKGRRTLAYEMLQMTPMDALCPYGPWQVVASQITSSMAQTSSAGGSVSNGSGSGSNGIKGSHGDSIGNYYQMSLSPSSGSASVTPAGHEYREVVRVLERGLRSTPNLPWTRWQALFCTICDRVRDDAGEAGLAMCVLDPLAKTMTELLSQTTSAAASPTVSRAIVELLSVATHPRDRQAVDAAKRRLWGSAIASSGPMAPFDPFDHFYKLVSNSLRQAYVSYDAGNHDSAVFGTALLKELTGFFGRSNEQLFLKALASVQDGLAEWVQDLEGKLNRGSSAADAITSLWDALCALLERAGGTSSGLPIATLEPILHASFAGKHRHIVNATLVMWNKIYSGYEGVLDYPERLREALVTLQVYVDIPIPGLDITLTSSGGAQQPLFVDTEDDVFHPEAVITLSSAGSHMNEASTPRPALSKSHSTPTHTPLSATSPSSVHRGSNGKSKKSAKKDKMLRREKSESTPARPRHDDSQIEFTAIDFPSAVTSSAAESTAKDIDAAEESQILTDRQREVRDRQRETNALYSDVISSSPTGEAAARKLSTATRTVPARESSVSLPQQVIEPALVQASLCQENEQEKRASSPASEDVALPDQVRTATPEPPTAAAGPCVTAAGAFAEDEFIASTPTPRRGQALVFPETHDNEIDSPSSPPEPRRYPLLPDISSRSRSSSILDEWQFSSSPLSGSPIAARHTLPEPELSIDGVIETSLGERVQVTGGHSGGAAHNVPSATEQAVNHEPPTLKPTNDGDVDMEDAVIPASADVDPALMSSRDNLTVQISPLVHRKSRPPTSPATPRQTRRQSALSQEMSQENHADDESSTGDISFSGSASTSVPQSLPRAHRKDRKASASKAVAQSSPIRASGSSGRRYRLMAMPPPSMHNVSFRMSDGEERSMLRLAIELDMVNKQSQPEMPSSPVPSAPPSTRSSSKVRNNASTDGLEALDCITVWTSHEKNEKNGKNDKKTKKAKNEQADTTAGSPESSQQTPSQRSRRRKRKRSASAQADDVAIATASFSPGVTSRRAERKLARARRHTSEARSERSQKTASPAPADAVQDEEGASTTAEVGLSSRSKRVVADETASKGSDGDHDVQSQLALELRELSSRSTHNNVVDLTAVADTSATTDEVNIADDIEPDSVVEVDVPPASDEDRPTKKPRLAGILSLLRGSLTLLNSATLSREEVDQVEDVCMDVKRALYDAERRGRD